MNSSDFRLEARKKLQGKWGNAIGIVFTFLLLSFFLELIQRVLPNILQIILNIIIIIIGIPLSFGVTFSFLNLFKTQNTFSFNFLEFFDLGFSNFKRAWAVKWHILLKMILPVLLVIILSFSFIITGLNSYYRYGFFSEASYTYRLSRPYGNFATSILFIASVVAYIWSITKSYYYALADLIAIENPNMSAKEAVQKSENLMKGNRLKLFFLHLSFIGWMILATFTFGIGFLWLIPYMIFATIAFYIFLVGDINSAIDVTNYSDSDNINNNNIDNNTDNM